MNNSNLEEEKTAQTTIGGGSAQTQPKPRRFDKQFEVVTIPDKNKDKDGKSVLIVREDFTGNLYAAKAVSSSLKSDVKELYKEVANLEGLTDSKWTIKCVGYV